MFVVKPCETFTKSVHFSMIQEDGTYKPQNFTAKFKRKSQSEIEQQLNETQRTQDDDEFMKEVFIGWSDVKDPNGNIIEFSETNRDLVLDIPEARRAVMTAYFEAYKGPVGKK